MGISGSSVPVLTPRAIQHPPLQPAMGKNKSKKKKAENVSGKRMHLPWSCSPFALTSSSGCPQLLLIGLKITKSIISTRLSISASSSQARYSKPLLLAHWSFIFSKQIFVAATRFGTPSSTGHQFTPSLCPLQIAWSNWTRDDGSNTSWLPAASDIQDLIDDFHNEQEQLRKNAAPTADVILEQDVLFAPGVHPLSSKTIEQKLPRARGSRKRREDDKKEMLEFMTQPDAVSQWAAEKFGANPLFSVPEDPPNVQGR